MTDLAELTIRLKSEGVKQARDDMGRFIKTTKGAPEALDKTTGAMLRTSKTARTFSGSLSGLYSSLSPLLGGFAALSIIRSTVSTIADFNATMSEVRGVAIPVTASLEEQERQYVALEKAARAAGATTRFSAAQAADAELALARAGLTTDQVTDALVSTLNLAAGASLDLGQATSIAASAMNQFQLEAKDVAHVADVLTISANSADTNVAALGEALSYAGDVAKGFGLDIETTSALLSTFAKAGITGSRAGTSLRAALSRLAKPTEDAQHSLRAFGLEVEDIDFSNITKTFEKLREGSEKLSQQDFATNALRIFGQIAAPAGIAAIQFAGNLEALKQKFKELDGEAQRQADIQNNTLKGSYLALKSAIEELQLQTGDAGLLGTLKTTVDFLTDVTRSLGGVEAATLTNAKAVAAFVAVLKGLLGYFVVLKGLKLSLVFFDLGKAIFASVTSVNALSAALATNPIGVIAVTVGLLITAYQLLKDKTLEIGDTTYAVSDIVGGVWDYIVDKVEAYISVAKKFITIFGAAWGLLTKYIADEWGGLIAGLGSLWDLLWSGIGNVAKTSINYIVALLVGLGKTNAIVFGRLKDAVFAFAEFDFSNPFESLGKVKNKIVEALDVSNIASEIGDSWSTAFKTDFVGNTLDLISSLGKDAKKALRSLLSEEEFRLIIEDQVNPLSAIASIKERIEARRKEREATQAAGEAASAAAKQEKEDLDKLQSTLDALKNSLEGANAEHAKLSATARKARETFGELIEEIKKETFELGLSSEEVEKHARELLFADLVQKGFSKNLFEMAGAALAFGAAIGSLDAKRKLVEQGKAAADAKTELEKMSAEIKNETELVGLTADERERAIFVREAEALAAKDATGALNEYVKKLTEEYDSLQRLKKGIFDGSEGIDRALEKFFSKERFVEIGSNLGDAFGEAFAQVLTDINSVDDALESLVKKVIQIGTESFITAPLKGLFSSLGGSLAGSLFGSAKGNVFSGGSIIPFANGGIIDQLTLFPLSGGKTGAAGEAGPEAIFPLTRDNQGNLGVRAQGGGQTTIIEKTTHQTNKFIFPNAQNPGDFRKSRKQLAQDLRDLQG